ncbi:MAG: hypothetical protein KGL39_20625 [Patescibacteria group bacterium]|nr:hypothetical protein [Patescibacteria group bacterium]
MALTGHQCNECGLCHSKFSGEPHRVLAVSRPFLLLQLNEGGSHGLDLREWSVTRLDERYVKAWFRSNSGPDNECEDRDDHARCVRCGERMRQRHVGASWRWYCPKCGSDGGRVTV